MSCQINQIAYVINPDEVKAKLLQDAPMKHHVSEDELPLQDCLLSLSSTGDVLILALHQTIVLLTSKWDLQESGEVKNKFSITWSGRLSSEPSEYITTLICLPLASIGKSNTSGSIDWNCIAVGFNTGYLRFYTETGALLLEEQLHNESLLGIKCQSLTPPKHAGDAGSSEEIHILYNSAVCILGGFSLFSTLRSRRNQLARVQANCGDDSLIDSFQNSPSGLVYKKYGFKDQDVANDCEVVGITSVNTFDHLMTASIHGGYNTSYRSSAPQHNLIIVTGKRPFIGFHYALEGGAPPVLSEVAIAMASSLASAIGRIGTAVPWLKSNLKVGQNSASGNSGNSDSAISSNGSKGSNDDSNRSSGTSQALERGKPSGKETLEPMTCRFGLSDVLREGDSLITSPNKTLSVITDAMGRVILINNKRGVALRMWKGYRDAQCGWIQATEDRNQSKNRGDRVFREHRSSQNTLKTATFLVIYAPKKGIIDIWGIQQGGKITTFSASKNGRLIYSSNGLLGLNDTAPVISNKPQYACVFMDPYGGLKEISVPFHFALSSKNSRRARDIHLLKKLKVLMREIGADEEKLVEHIRSICTELKTNEIRLQIVGILMHSKHVSPGVLSAAVECFIDSCTSFKGEDDDHDGDDDHNDPSGKALFHITNNLHKAIEFYKYVKQQFDNPPEYNTIVSDSSDSKDLSRVLLTSECEINRILELSKNFYEYKPVKSQTRVTFELKDDLFLAFISAFDFERTPKIGLINGMNEEKKYQIGSLIYQGWMYSSKSVEEWIQAARSSNICLKSMMELALIFWLNKSPGAPLEIELTRFTQLLQGVCDINDDAESSMNSSIKSTSWWNDMRSILMSSTRPFQALTAALSCRSVEITIQKIKDRGPVGPDGSKAVDDEELSKGEKKSPEDWENISNDTCQFTLLIATLEDLSFLNAVLNEPPPSDPSTTNFSLPFEKVDISMSYIIAKGKGSVSELVAKWLSASGMDPAHFSNTFNTENLQKTDTDTGNAEDKGNTGDKGDKGDAKDTDKASNPDPHPTAQDKIIQKITSLKQHFPYSLNCDVILANLCWEFVMFWSKDITQLQSLEAALNILKIIPMKALRHGVCSLLWTIHIKKRLEITAKLVNKLGKLPKERLCIQDIGLSDIQSTIFLKYCVMFLEIFLDSEIAAPESHTVFKFEELWEGQGQGSGSQAYGPQPFVILAITQAPASYDSIMLHLQLANVLHMMAHFSIKVVKPMFNLFDSITSRYFFADITDKAFLAWYKDDKRDHFRIEFLNKIITASIESINQGTDISDGLGSNQATLWMTKCLMLGSLWKIDKDKLRIHEVCQLYINGFDKLAEEISTAVNDTEELAVNLLPIAGRRMMAYLSQTPHLLEEISSLSPSLVKYLENIDIPRDGIMATSSNDNTIELIRKLSRYLSDDHKDYHIAQMMLDATFIYEGKI